MSKSKGPVEYRILKGFPPVERFTELVGSLNPALVGADLLAEWESGRRALEEDSVRGGTPQLALSELPSEVSTAASFFQNSDVRRQLVETPTELLMTRLADLIVAPTVVNLTYARVISEGLRDGGIAEDVALSTASPMGVLQATHSVVAGTETYLISSESHDIRWLDSSVQQLDGRVAIVSSFGGGTNLARAVVWQDRAYLANGNHRVAAMVLAGRDYAPVVVQWAERADQLPLLLGQEFLAGWSYFSHARRPPVATDLAQPGLAFNFSAPQVQKVLRATLTVETMWVPVAEGIEYTNL